MNSPCPDSANLVAEPTTLNAPPVNSPRRKIAEGPTLFLSTCTSETESMLICSEPHSKGVSPTASPIALLIFMTNL